MALPFRKSIGFRLLGVSFLLLALPLLVDSFILIQRRYRDALAQAQGQLVEAAHLRALPLSQIQPVNAHIMEKLAELLDLSHTLSHTSPIAFNTTLKELSTIGKFGEILLLTIDKKGRYQVVAAADASYLKRDYTDFFRFYDAASENFSKERFSSYLAYDLETLQPYCLATFPVGALSKEDLGLLAIADGIGPSLNRLLAPENTPYSIRFCLLFPQSIVFASSDSEMLFSYFFPLTSDFTEEFIKINPFADKLIAEQPLPVTAMRLPFFEFTWKAESQIGYLRDLPYAHASLLVYASKKEIFQLPLLDYFTLYSIYGVIFLIGGTLVYLLTLRMAKPMQRLSRVMEEIQKGRLHARYALDFWGFEINTLGMVFNEMVQNLTEQQHLIERELVSRELFLRELKLGQQVQHRLLPQRMPTYQGVEISNLYVPAIEVGGDFYDAFVKKEDEREKLVLAIADASGKGVQACFYSLCVRQMLRIYAEQYNDIAVAMHATNQLFRIDTGETGMFVTVLAAVYDRITQELSYYSSGHNPALVRRQNGEVEVLKKGGIAMGVFSWKISTANTLKLHTGDLLIFYTDGITEASNSQDELFGEERLMRTVREANAESASDLAGVIMEAVYHFVAGAPQHDDITLLVMRIV